MRKLRAVVVGSSAGGLKALEAIFSRLTTQFPLPIAVVQHVSADSDGMLSSILAGKTSLQVKEARDKEALEPGTVYIAPPNYHLLVENDESLSLSVDEKENYARPSIDILFESAADAFGAELIGIILTGASADGARGLKKIKDKGGLTIVQDPETAESKVMPQSALERSDPDYLLSVEEIGPLLTSLCQGIS